jgi:predicted RNase H-like HicB family nuclease
MLLSNNPLRVPAKIRYVCYTTLVKNIIQFWVSQENGTYTASGVNVPIVTDGKTFEELQVNIKEAVELYFENEDTAELGFGATPSILTSFELSLNFHGSRT